MMSHNCRFGVTRHSLSKNSRAKNAAIAVATSAIEMPTLMPLMPHAYK